MNSSFILFTWWRKIPLNTGEKEAVKLLIELGADVNAKDTSNHTPLYSARNNRKTIHIISVNISKTVPMFQKKKIFQMKFRAWILEKYGWFSCKSIFPRHQRSIFWNGF